MLEVVCFAENGLRFCHLREKRRKQARGRIRISQSEKQRGIDREHKEEINGDRGAHKQRR